MVTPTWLNGNDCATADPVASIDASHKLAIKALIEASLGHDIRVCLRWSIFFACRSPKLCCLLESRAACQRSGSRLSVRMATRQSKLGHRDPAMTIGLYPRGGSR